MPSSDDFWEYLFHIPEFSKVDNKILVMLIEVRGDNAYSIWKKSGLKHYPTVLRSLKKLQRGGFVRAKRTVGMRSTKQYELTLLGTISVHLLRKDKKSLHAILAENSLRFRDLVTHKFKDIDSVAGHTINTFMNFLLSRREDLQRITLDQVIEDEFNDRISQDLMDIHDRDSKSDLLEIVKIPWIRKLALQILDTEIDWASDMLKEWTDLKEFLTV